MFLVSGASIDVIFGIMDNYTFQLTERTFAYLEHTLSRAALGLKLVAF